MKLTPKQQFWAFVAVIVGLGILYLLFNGKEFHISSPFGDTKITLADPQPVETKPDLPSAPIQTATPPAAVREAPTPQSERRIAVGGSTKEPICDVIVSGPSRIVNDDEEVMSFVMTNKERICGPRAMSTGSALWDNQLLSWRPDPQGRISPKRELYFYPALPNTVEGLTIREKVRVLVSEDSTKTSGTIGDYVWWIE